MNRKAREHRARRHPLPEPARARRGRARLDRRGLGRAAPRGAPRPDHPAVRRHGSRDALRRAGRRVHRQPPGRSPRLRRREDGAHGARGLVAGRLRPCSRAWASPPRCSARRPRRSAIATSPRCSASASRATGPRASSTRDRTYARVAVGWGREPLALVAPRTIVRPTPTGRPLVERVVAPGRRDAACPRRSAARHGRRHATGRASSRARRSSRPDAEPEPTLAQKARWVAGRSVDRLVGLVS